MYSCRYRKEGQIFWRKIKNVVGDGIVQESPGVRYFIQVDQTRIEIGMDGAEIRFSPDRFHFIQKKMESEAKQPISLKEMAKS